MLTLSCNAYAEILDIKVVSVDKAKAANSLSSAEAESCTRWKMTDKEIETFFKKGLEFKKAYITIFDTYPCNIYGKLQLDGKDWSFHINEGGMADLKHNDSVKYFVGCIDDDADCYQELDQFKDLE